MWSISSSVILFLLGKNNFRLDISSRVFSSRLFSMLDILEENADAAVHVLVMYMKLMQLQPDKYLYLLYRDLSEGHLSNDHPAFIWSLNIHSVCSYIHTILH